LWATALDSNEIVELYKGRSPLAYPIGLRGYWPLGAFEGRNLANNGLDFTKVGTIPFDSGQPDVRQLNASYSFVAAQSVAGPGVDTTTVYVDITTSFVEVVGIAEVGTAYVDIQPSGPDGVTHFDLATVYCDIGIHTCEWFIPRPESEYIWAEYTKWSYAANTKWSISAGTKWQWDVKPVDNTPVEICS
jgi:hypothetical protein